MRRGRLGRLERPAPPVEEGEQLRESWQANHTRGGLAVGGALWLSTTRLVFVPNRFERWLGRSDWSCDLGDVTDVRIAKRGTHPTNGAWRQRLAIDHGGVDLFVVNHVHDVASAIESARHAPA